MDSLTEAEEDVEVLLLLLVATTAVDDDEVAILDEDEVSDVGDARDREDEVDVDVV